MRHEKMRVLAAAERLLSEVESIVSRVQSRAPNVTDHARRAAESVLFNTAEGVAAYAPKVKISCYEIAKREASEVRAALKALVIRGALTPDETRPASNLASAIISMLSSASRTLEKRAPARQ